MTGALQQLDYIVGHFHTRQQPRNGRAQVFCPGHDDKRKESLSIAINEDGTRIMLFCHVCGKDATPAIVEAAGLTMQDLFIGDGAAWIPQPRPATPPKALKPTAPPKAKRDRVLSRSAYPCRDAAGTLIATKHRLDWRLADGATEKAYYWQLPGREDAGLHGIGVETLPLSGSERLKDADPSKPAILDEGEKAARALIDRDLVAVGSVTGAGVTPCDASLAVLAGRVVILWPDNDDAGRTHMERIAARLLALPEEQRPASVRMFTWRAAPAGGDAADYQGDTATLLALLDNAPDWTPPASISADMTLRGDCADKDRIIAAQTEQLIEQDREIARLEDRLRHQVRVSAVWRVHAKKRQALHLQALRKGRALEDAERVPLFAGRVPTVRAIARAVADAPEMDHRPDGFVRVRRWKTALDAGQSEDTFTKTLASLREKGLVLTEYVGAGKGKDAREHLYVKLPDFTAPVAGGEAAAIAVLERLTRRAPRDRRTGKKGQAHGGARPTCRRCGPDAVVVEEVTRTWRCSGCNAILESQTRTVGKTHHGSGLPVHEAMPAQTQVASAETLDIQTQVASVAPAQPLLRLVDDTWPAPMCDAPGCAASATVTYDGKDYCAAHARADTGPLARTGGD